ncbi:MAG: (2Fe-2S)-binding protein [Acidimicrobiales bacterium]
MIICHCRVVSDRHIRDEVACGARSADDIAESCGAGAHCGSCRPTIGVLLATLLAPEQVEPAA